MEAADICCPPGDSGEPHLQAGHDLVAEILIGGVDIAGPDQGTVLLASCPCTAHQVQNVLLAGCFLAFIEAAGVFSGVNVSLLHDASGIVTVVFVIIGGIFRFRFIQPEEFDSVFPVILSAFLPDIFSGLRVGGIIEYIVALEIHLDVQAVFCLDEKTLLAHLLEVLTAPVDLGPHGYHKFHSVRAQFFRHGLGIREEMLIKTVVSAPRPVIIVNHKHIHRNAPAVIFSGNRQYLFLVMVAQFALPEAQSAFRHHGSAPCHLAVLGFDLSGSVACCDPVIHFFGAVSPPLCHIFAKRDTADGGIVPEEAVAFAGYIEGDGCLGVSVGQFNIAAFQIQDILLILAHAVYFFILVGLKADLQTVIAADIRGKFTGPADQGAAVYLFEQYFLFVVKEGDNRCAVPASCVNESGDFAVCDRGSFLVCLNLCV